MALVAVAEFVERLDADLARLRLAGEGIESHIFDGGMSSLGLGVMTPARLMVHRDDADAARDLLAAGA